MSSGSYGYYAAAPPGGAPAHSVAPPVAPPTSVTPSSGLYGEQRPTFSENGQGAPYSTTLNLVAGTSIYNDISYDTSSKDPHMIRARVFIGNIARAIITRDDIIELFRPFGKILAVNYFAQQGFGFVQFNEASHADKSCLSLNGTSWKSCCLDVHLAMLGAMTKKPAAGGGGGGGGAGGVGGGRDGHGSVTLVPPVTASALPVAQGPLNAVHQDGHIVNSGKRAYDEEEYEIFKQNKRNKQFANSDKTQNEDLMPNEMCDTMVCGHCRFVTSDFEEFKEHRIAGCQRYRDPDEPRHRLKCATCSQRFLGAWGLLEHLTEFHRMLLYNEERITPADLAQMRNTSVEHSAPSSIPDNTSALPTGASSSARGVTPISANSTPVYPITSSVASENGTPQI